MTDWPGGLVAITLFAEDLPTTKQFYLDVFTLEVDDVDAKCRELEALGVQLLNGPMDRPWGPGQRASATLPAKSGRSAPEPVPLQAT